jgi:hypothetical protein
MKTVGEFYNYILGIKTQMDQLTFFLFDRFYSRMCLNHGPDLTLEEIRRKTLKEMLELGNEDYTQDILREYESKNFDLDEIKLFLKLTKSIFKQ